MPRFAVTPLDQRVYAILAEAGFADDLFNPRQHRSCELVELYVLHLALDLIERLGVNELLRHPRTLEELLVGQRYVPAFRVPLRWLLERLVAAGVVMRDDSALVPRYAAPAPLPPAELATLRAAGLESDPSYAPAFALLDEAAAIYPKVARGETSGERALFQKVALWIAYFNNHNAYYALTNQVAARAAAVRLGRGSVLEVGAGLGSATEALLQVLSDRRAPAGLVSYLVTEPVQFFRRRAQRTLEVLYPGLPLAFAALDINRPWREQGIAPGELQLVWGLNVFHLARDLAATLREAFAALAPGGWLVLGEGMRPFPGQLVGAEFPFQILESFVDVDVEPATRPTPGFLTAEQWTAALERVGCAPVEVVPDAIRLRALYPAFPAAAVCGRRPGTGISGS